MPVIDLTITLNEYAPIFPGDPKPEFAPSGLLQDDGYNAQYMSVFTHTGTHIDAPCHVLEYGKTLDQFPIEQFVGRGRYVALKGGGYDLELVRAADIEAGDIVIFDTGMADKLGQAAYFENYPVLSREIGSYLIEKRVKMIGVDTCSVDGDDQTIHRLLLSSGVLICENLTNVRALRGKDFTVYALPAKIQMDGAPARVIAQV